MLCIKSKVTRRSSLPLRQSIYIYIYSLPRRLPRESTAAKAGAITHKDDDDDVRWNEEQYCLSLHRGLSLSFLFFFFGCRVLGFWAA